METHSIGRNLVYQRKSKGYAQERLAEKSKVTVRTIQRIENDEVNPQLQTIQLLADALEIKIDELQVVENPKEENLQTKWLLFMHSSPLLGFIFPFSVLFPLFIWLHKREDNPVYNEHGIKVINYQLSITIVYVLAVVALVTIEKWGFFFFMAVIPFSFLVMMYNIIRATTSQECYYPLSIPFLKHAVRKTTPLILILVVFLGGCSASIKKTEYETLLDYEGKYESIDNTSLGLQVSELDTTLYAIIDDAKYPLNHIALDSFIDMQGTAVIFNRNKSNEVINYKSDGRVFKLFTKEFERMEMLPRQDLFHNQEGYKYQQPRDLNDGLKTGQLQEEFKNPERIIDMVKETITGGFPEVHSILIYKNNKLILEEYFYGYDKDTPHQMRSASKSFIGGIVGIAVDMGYIKSEKDNILPYFKTRYPEIANIDDRKRQQTIEDFLMYRHGLDCDDNNPDSEGNHIAMMESEDWVKNTLDLPMIADPGASISYCSGCSLTLGCLVEITTNSDIEDFAKENLFDPLGITNYNWTFEPNRTSINTFSQMYITPRDLVKLAKCYKDDGKWQVQQIISEDWVNKTFNMNAGDYGYLWYQKYFDINDQRYTSYQASGNGGQKINIWPELDMITVFTGGNYNSYQLYGKSTPPNEMIPDYILKAVE